MQATPPFPDETRASWQRCHCVGAGVEVVAQPLCRAVRWPHHPASCPKFSPICTGRDSRRVIRGR